MGYVVFLSVSPGRGAMQFSPAFVEARNHTPQHFVIQLGTGVRGISAGLARAVEAAQSCPKLDEALERPRRWREALPEWSLPRL